MLLPVVLGIVWLGGWWLFALALLGGLLALHELYAMGRGLRPIVLGGYVGLVLTLLGVQLGEISWMLGGILSTLAGRLRRLRLLGRAAVGDGRDLLTLLGVVWVGGGLGSLLLLRDIPENGRLASSPC